MEWLDGAKLAGGPATGPLMTDAQGAAVEWQPQRPRLNPLRLALSWVLSTASLYVAAALVSGESLHGFGGALIVAALIAQLNGAPSAGRGAAAPTDPGAGLRAGAAR